MNRTIRVILTGAAMTLVLGGCSGATQQHDPKTATPQQQWARSLCQALEPTTVPVEPPATGGSAAESHEAIVTFLRTLRDRLEAQAAVLEDAGVPPEVDPATFERAQESLDSGARTLRDVIWDLQSADSADAGQMEAALRQVSESLAESSSYDGPLAELSAGDEGLKKAFENDKTCVSIMS